eukprot:TRINITY_DN50156_c0_g1_i1.p1 TRINITY_DN50156_c0_g1~~TRINITY_DN50156_c0_g1_i1.p1  ORF type:complete len:504 (-),score=42.70 TRINITY_DN50156_c0_g1_i1:58-1569(-)
MMQGALLLTACLAARALASPHFWPIRNGNKNRSGFSPHITAPSKLVGPAWSFEEPYPESERFVIYGTPLIDSSRNVYIATTAGRLYALDEYGRLCWNHSENELWLGDCALEGSAIYCCARSGSAFALDAATGSELWRRQITLKFLIPTDGFSVVIANETMICPANSEDMYLSNSIVVALSTIDGSDKWRIDLPVPGFNFMPAIIDDTVMFADVKGGMHRVSLKDGERIWYTPGAYDAYLPTGGAVVGPSGLAFVVTTCHSYHALLNYYLHILNYFQTLVTGLCVLLAVAFLTRFAGLSKCFRLTIGTFVLLSFMCGSVYVVLYTFYREKYAELRALRVSNGEVVWSFNGPGESAAAPSVAPIGEGDSLQVIVGYHHCKNASCKNRVHGLEHDSGKVAWTFHPPPLDKSTQTDFENPEKTDPTKLCIPDRFTNSAVGVDGTIYINMWDGAWALKDANRDGHIYPDDPSEVSVHNVSWAMQGAPAIAPGMVVVAGCYKVVAFKEN